MRSAAALGSSDSTPIMTKRFDAPYLRRCRGICAAFIALPLVACAALATSDYKAGLLYQDMGLSLGARNSFARAAKEGSAEAQNMMGWYWANGLGHLPKDTIQACNWYAEAADHGLPDAINNLAACYEYPGFIQQDMTKAVALYTLAARKGNPKAQQNLIRLGRPVPAADLAPQQPTKSAVQEPSKIAVSQPPPVRQAAQQPVARQAPQQPPREDSGGSGGDWAAAAEAVLSIFVASKGYGTAPPPVFIPPRSITVHCNSQMLGQTAVSNCY